MATDSQQSVQNLPIDIHYNKLLGKSLNIMIIDIKNIYCHFAEKKFTAALIKNCRIQFFYK